MTSKNIVDIIAVYKISNWSERRKMLLNLRGAGGNPALEAFARIAHLDPVSVQKYVVTVLRRRHCTRIQKQNFLEPEPPRLPGEYQVNVDEAHEVAEATAGALAEARHGRRDNTASKNSDDINTQKRSRKIDSSQAQERALPENMHVVSFRR
jgi:hypothetical protein